MNEYRFYRNLDPFVAKVRRDLAAFYRQERAKNPKRARVLWRAAKNAERKAHDMFWSSDWVNTKGGLAEILK